MVGLVIFLFFVSPEKLPLYALFIPFVAIFFINYVVLGVVVDAVLKNVNSKTRRWFTLGVAALPVVLLILQSSGQMSFSDLWLFLLLAVILLLYLRKTDFLR